MTMNIGFLGLGQMGRAMAANLLRAGHRVTVWNRSPGPAEALAELGAKHAQSPADAALGSELIVTMLANDDALEAVAFGPAGFAAALTKDAVHLSASTISVALAERLTAEHQARGQHFLSAPVFGRPDQAAAAKLFVAIAGPSDQIERVRPVLDVLGQRVFIVGDQPPQANLVKLTGNFLITCVIESLAEAYALTEKGGIDRSVFHELLTETLFAAPIYKVYGKMILEGKFSPAGFAMSLGQKDNRLVQQAAETLSVPLPLASLVRDRFLAALANGDEALDWSGIAKRAAADAGLEPR